jgi:hypothetical protein
VARDLSKGRRDGGVVTLFSLEVEVFIPFTCGFDCGDPCACTPFTLDALVLEVVVGPAVGSADDWRLVEVFCGHEVSASWQTRLPFESFVTVSADGSLILGPELGDPKAGERYRYRLRRALSTPRHLYVPLGFLDSVLIGVYVRLSRWERGWTRKQ